MTRVPPGPAPVVYDDVRLDLVDQVAREVLERARVGPRSHPTLNQGGWRSTDLLAWGAPAVTELVRTVGSIVGGSVWEAWAMVNARGSHHPRHVHHGAHRSAVYYVRPGGPGSPSTVFEVSTGRGRETCELQVEPRPGRLVVFWGGTPHRVPPYLGDDPRITVAVDTRTAAT